MGENTLRVSKVGVSPLSEVLGTYSESLHCVVQHPPQLAVRLIMGWNIHCYLVLSALHQTHRRRSKPRQPLPWLYPPPLPPPPPFDWDEVRYLN